jgi:hypothetical protein
MSVYYSIINIITRPSIGECIAVGLILTDGETVLSKFSDTKISIVAKFFDSRGQRLLKAETNALKTRFSGRPTDENKQKFASRAHLQKVSIYNNNMWTVSAPENIKVELTDEKLNQLFKIFIDGNEVSEDYKAENNVFKPLKTNFYPTIKTKADIDYTLKSDDLPTLFSTIKLNLIGQNGKITVGQEIDFHKSSTVLGGKLEEILTIERALQAHKSIDRNYFLIGNEPPKTLEKQHKMWATIRQQAHITIVPIAEVEMISTYLENNEVRPYSFFNPRSKK